VVCGGLERNCAVFGWEWGVMWLDFRKRGRVVVDGVAAELARGVWVCGWLVVLGLVLGVSVLGVRFLGCLG
jgi:hypothetical protein